MKALAFNLIYACVGFAYAGSLCGRGEGWFYRPDPPVCYYLSPPGDKANFAGAVTKCAVLGATVASVNTQAEMDYIQENILKCYASLDTQYWINLRKDNVTGTMEERRVGWEWGDGSPYTYPAWSLWSSAEPAEGEECCRVNQGEWWGISCGNFAFRYLCTKQPSAQDELFKEQMFVQKSTNQLTGSINENVTITNVAKHGMCAYRCMHSECCAHFTYDSTNGECILRCRGLMDGSQSYVKAYIYN